MVDKTSFDKDFYTYTINSIGQYTITSFKIRAFRENHVESVSGMTVAYEKIFNSNTEVGMELDKIEQKLKKKS